MLELSVIGFLVALIVMLLVRALMKSKQNAKLLKLQGHEIQKQVLLLEQHNQQLHELNQEKLQVISLVSHDLKGPFNRIFALIQLMNLTEQNLTAEQKEYLGKIHQVSVDGLSMIRNLLDSRKLDHNGVELTNASVDLSALVSSLVKNYRAIAEKKKIKIEMNNAGPITMLADRMYLGRMVENLLSNAVKFSPENKKIMVRLDQTPDQISLSIIDEGPGISAEDQPKLFQRFQPLSAKPTGAESSTGLGLFIVKTIAEKMGAEIRYENAQRQGANFTLVLRKKNP